MNHRIHFYLFCVLMLTATAFVQKNPGEHVWDCGDVHGPPHWGDLKPEFTSQLLHV